jgi:hypothetical protein
MAVVRDRVGDRGRARCADTERPAALGSASDRADNRAMSTPSVSPAYQQIVDWYQNFQKVQMSKPVPLLVTTGAPGEAADDPKETDPSTQTIDIIA